MNFGETNFQSIQLLDINSKFLFCKPPPIPFSFVDLSLSVTYMPGKSCPRLAPSCTARSRAAPAAPWRTGLWSSLSDTCDSHCCGCSRLKSPICFPHNPRSPLCSGFTDRAQGRPPPWYTPGIPWDLSQMPTPRAKEFSPGSLGPHAGRVASCILVNDIPGAIQGTGASPGAVPRGPPALCRVPRQGRAWS